MTLIPNVCFRAEQVMSQSAPVPHWAAQPYWMAGAPRLTVAHPILGLPAARRENPSAYSPVPRPFTFVRSSEGQNLLSRKKPIAEPVPLVRRRPEAVPRSPRARKREQNLLSIYRFVLSTFS